MYLHPSRVLATEPAGQFFNLLLSTITVRGNRWAPGRVGYLAQQAIRVDPEALARLRPGQSLRLGEFHERLWLLGYVRRLSRMLWRMDDQQFPNFQAQTVYASHDQRRYGRVYFVAWGLPDLSAAIVVARAGSPLPPTGHQVIRREVRQLERDGEHQRVWSESVGSSES
jgi:hypothetical protein